MGAVQDQESQGPKEDQTSLVATSPGCDANLKSVITSSDPVTQLDLLSNNNNNEKGTSATASGGDIDAGGTNKVPPDCVAAPKEENSDNDKSKELFDKSETKISSDPSGTLSPVDGGGEGSVVKPPKLSGIPAFSRIARPCIGHQKPAIPLTPAKNAFGDSVRGMTDEFGRHRLTDVQEENEDELLGISNRRIGSMDALWDTHSHRLSEAGLTRHSDATALTEDTDSFIIGDRVWVGGTKPGQIAYIGETQFAPGEWAGIVLDLPIGKNDGSVGGIRYFQCESKRGVFSRLTRLTRTPLGGADDVSFSSSSFVTTSTPFSNGDRRGVRSPLSPTGSARSLGKSPSLSISNTSLSSVSHIVDFKVGDRVIVKSSQGSKVGTLRYMGATDFAAGEWCGVELDDPRGKNDGSVEGKRYFECRSQFGLFAPVAKVSKSPMKYKPGNCVIHSGAGLPPSGIKRAGSRDSMTSMTSSIASTASGVRRVRLGVNSLTPSKKITNKSPASSGYPTRTALQDVLREKQQHIEQLLKERDLERAEVTRAAGQADEAEQKLSTLRSEYEHYRSECEVKLKEYTTVLSKLNIDRRSLLSQLDDEKRKNEDLQFRFEEAAITKGDIEVTNESNLRQINDLREQLKQEHLKVESLEADSGKLFEAEEALVKAREEVDYLKLELQNATSKHSSLEGEVADSVASLKKQLEISEQELKQVRLENENVIAELQTQIAASQETINKKGSVCSKQEEEIAALKAELAQTKALLQEKSMELEKKTSESNDLENNLKNELERSKRELNAKTVDLESNTDAMKSKDQEVKSLKTQLETTEIDLKSRVVDVERYRRNLEEVETSYKGEIEQLRNKLKTELLEKEEASKTSAIEISQRDAKLEDANKTIVQHETEIEKLKLDLSDAKESIERSSTEMHERHVRQVEMRENQLMAMAAEIQQKSEELAKCSIVTSKLEDDICTKNGVIDKLRLELDSFRRRYENEQLSTTKFTEQINALQLNAGDLQRKLSFAEQRVVELTGQKQHLEGEIQSIMSSTGDYSIKLQDLNSRLLAKEHAIEMARAEFLDKLQMSQRAEQQLKIELEKHHDEANRNRMSYEEKLQLAIEGEKALRQRCDMANAETAKVRDELIVKVNDLQRLLDEKDFELKKLLSECGESQQIFKDQLARSTGDLHKTIETCQKRIDELTSENINCKSVIVQKSELAIKTDAKLKHLAAQSQQNEMEIRKTFEEQIRKTQFQLDEKVNQVQQCNAEIELLKRDCANQNVNIVEKDHNIAQLVNELQTTRQLVTKVQLEKDHLQLKQIEAGKVYDLNNQKCNDLLNQIAILSNKADMAEKLAEEMRVQKSIYTRLFEQLQITERQKQDLIVRLEDAANKNGEADKCYYMLELARNLQATNADEQAKKIMDLQKTIIALQQQLSESSNQALHQKNEILGLQEALLKAQQMCVTSGQGALKSVSNVNGFTQNTSPQYTPFVIPNPLHNTQKLHTQLVSVKNVFTALQQKFVSLQNINSQFIINLQTALDSGDMARVYSLLRKSKPLKQYFNDFRGSIEADTYKLLKIISYTMLNLQNKQSIINSLLSQMKDLQNNYYNLPLQCKLALQNYILSDKHFDSLNCPVNNAQIQLDEAQKLLNLKDMVISNLKKEILNLQENVKMVLYQMSKSSGSPCPGNLSLNQMISLLTPPSASNGNISPLQCPPPKVIIKEIPVYTCKQSSQTCKQVFPPYMMSHSIVGNNINPLSLKACPSLPVIIRKTPVVLPQLPNTIIKEVPVPLVNGKVCPSPKIIVQRVPIFYPPKSIVKEVPFAQAPRIIVKEVPVPIIYGKKCPTPNVIVQKIPVPQPPRVVIKEVPIPQPPRVIIKQIPMPLPVRIIIKKVPVYPGSTCPPPQIIEKPIPVVQPVRETVKEIPVPQPPRIIEIPWRPTQMKCYAITQPLIDRLKNDIYNLKLQLSSSKSTNTHWSVESSECFYQSINCFVKYVKQQMSNIVRHPMKIMAEHPEFQDFMLNYLNQLINNIQLPGTLSEFSCSPQLSLINQINHLKQQVKYLLVNPKPVSPSLESFLVHQRTQMNALKQHILNLMHTLDASSGCSILKQPIQNLLGHLNIIVKEVPANNVIGLTPFKVTSLESIILQQKNQMDSLKRQILNILSTLNNSSSCSVLKQQIQILLLNQETNLKDLPDVDTSSNTLSCNTIVFQLRNQIYALKEQIANLLSTASGSPTLIDSLRRQVQYLLSHPKFILKEVFSNKATGITDFNSIVKQQRNEINVLKQQISNLLSKLNTFSCSSTLPKKQTEQLFLHHQELPVTKPNIAFSIMAPHFKTILMQQRNEIHHLRQQLSNLLPCTSLNNFSKALINSLRQQIQYLTTHPKIIAKEVPSIGSSFGHNSLIMQQRNEINVLKQKLLNLMPMLDVSSLVTSSDNSSKALIDSLRKQIQYLTAHPKTIVKKVAVNMPCHGTSFEMPDLNSILTQQKHEINVLKQQIFNLLSRSDTSSSLDILKQQIQYLLTHPKVIVKAVPFGKQSIASSSEISALNLIVKQQRNEINILRQQISNLLSRLNTPSSCYLTSSSSDNALKLTINALRQQIQYLLNHPKVVVNGVATNRPNISTSFETSGLNEVNVLRQQISNHLTKLNAFSCSTTQSSDNALKSMLNALTQQIQNLLLHPKVIVKELPVTKHSFGLSYDVIPHLNAMLMQQKTEINVLRQQLSLLNPSSLIPSSDNFSKILINSLRKQVQYLLEHPKIIVKEVFVNRPGGDTSFEASDLNVVSRQQANQITILRQQIFNLLSALNTSPCATMLSSDHALKSAINALRQQIQNLLIHPKIVVNESSICPSSETILIHHRNEINVLKRQILNLLSQPSSNNALRSTISALRQQIQYLLSHPKTITKEVPINLNSCNSILFQQRNQINVLKQQMLNLLNALNTSAGSSKLINYLRQLLLHPKVIVKEICVNKSTPKVTLYQKPNTIIKVVPTLYPSLPILTKPRTCLLPSEVVSNININGFSPLEITNFKKDLYNLLLQQVTCNTPVTSINKQVSIPNLIIRQVPILQLPKSLIVEIPMPFSHTELPPKVILHRVPLPQTPRIIEKMVPVILPPKIIIKEIPIPVIGQVKCPPPKLIPQNIPVLQPPKIILKEVPIHQPPKIVIKQVNIPQPPKIITKYIPIPMRGNEMCPSPKVFVQKIPIMQPPRIIIKEVPIPQPSRVIVKEVPVKQPPLFIVKEVPSVLRRPCSNSQTLLTEEVSVPVSSHSSWLIEKLQKELEYLRRELNNRREKDVYPPRIMLNELPVSIGKKVSRVITKTVPVLQDSTVSYTLPPKFVVNPVPFIGGRACPPPIIIPRQVPPRIVLKEIPVPIASHSSSWLIKNLQMQLEHLRKELSLIKEGKVMVAPVSGHQLQIENLVKQVMVPTIGGYIQQVATPQSPRIIVKTVPAPISTHSTSWLIKKLQTELKTLRNELNFIKEDKVITVPVVQSPKIVLKEVPIPIGSEGPKIIIQRVPVPQVPKLIIKTVPYALPPKTVIKHIPVPVVAGRKCPPPIIIPQRVPVIQPQVVIKEVPIPQPPRIIVKEVEIPRIIVKQIPIFKDGIKRKVIVQRIPVLQPARTIIKEVPVNQPPRIIIKEITTPPKIIIKKIPISVIKNVPVLQPSRVIVKSVLQPPQIVYQKVPIFQPSTVLVRNVPLEQPPKVIYQKVFVPVAQPPKVIVQRVPSPPRKISVPIWQPPKLIIKKVFISQPPQIVVKRVPFPIIQPQRIDSDNSVPRIIVHKVPIPIIQPPRVVIKQVPVPSRPKVIIKEVPIFQPLKIIRVPIPILQPPRVIVKNVVTPQPPKIIIKRVPILQSPKIVIQKVPIIQRMPVPITYPTSITTKEVHPKVIIQRIPVQPPQVFVKEVSKFQPPKVIVKVLTIPQTPRFIIQKVPMFLPQPPKIITKQVPIFPTYQNFVHPPRTIIKEVPVPVGRNCNIPKFVIHRVPVPQPPMIFVKSQPVILPPKIILKEVPVPVINKKVCPSPQIFLQRVPVLQPPKVIFKEIPISQPPQVIIKQVPVPQPPRVITKEVPVLINKMIKCPTPRVIIQRIPVEQPPRIIIQEVPSKQLPRIILKEIPVPQPSRVIVKEKPCPVWNCPIQPSVTNVKILPIIQPPRILLKEVPVPVASGRVPKVLIQHIPLVMPPKVIVKTVPVTLPPKIIIKHVPVPVVNGRTCPGPKMMVQRIPIIQPPRTVLKEVPIPQPPQIIIKHVPIPQPPRVIVKRLPIIQGKGCPPQHVNIQKVPVFNQPRVIIKELLVPQPPRVIVKYLPQTPQIVVKEVPKMIVKEIPVFQPSSDLIKSAGISEFVNSLVASGFSNDQVFKFKKQLESLCIANSKLSLFVSNCPSLPNLNIPVGSSPMQFINNLQVSGTNSVQLYTFKQQLINLLQQVQSPICPTYPYRTLIKEIPVPTVLGKTCPPPKLLVHPVPVTQNPKVVLKEIPVLLPPRIIIRTVQVPSVEGARCPGPRIVKQPVPIFVSPKTMIKEIPVYQPPQIVIKQISVPQPPRVIIKQVPTRRGINCRVSSIALQRVPMVQPPRLVIKEVPLPQRPRIIVKKVIIPQPSKLSVKEVTFAPSAISLDNMLYDNAASYSSSTIMQQQNHNVESLLSHSIPSFTNNPMITSELQANLNLKENIIQYQKTEIYRLEQEILSLLKQLSDATPSIDQSHSMFPIVLQKQCLTQLDQQRTIIKQLRDQIKQLLSLKNVHDITNQIPFQNPSSTAIPLPMLHVLKSINPSMMSVPFLYSPTPLTSNGLRRQFMKALHGAFTHTQQALTQCMNSVLIQQLAFEQSQIENNGMCPNHQQLLEEKQLMEGQVQFLNSIIVDIQRKNEEQQSKIELLESGYSTAAADELKLYKLSERSVPPRVFCDICEEFDVHETEDCPLQATDDSPAPSTHFRMKREPPKNLTERPYCEFCEEFGHCTEDCKEDQTY